MRTISLALFLVALVSTQASFIEQIFNHTNLRGKANLNTTNGVNLDYNGSLSYNLSGLNINILDLGVHFDATPEKLKSFGDTSNASLRYNGGFTIAENGKTANLTLNGVAAVSAAVDQSYDNKSGVTSVAFSQSLNDNNTFVIRTASTTVEAKSSTGLSAAGLVQQKGNQVKVVEDLSLNVATKGSIIQNGTSSGFTASQSSSAHVSELVSVRPNATGRKPAADFVGHVNFTDAKYWSSESGSFNTSKKGGAKFGGHSWVKTGNGSVGVAVVEGVGYGFKEIVAVNNTVVAKTHAKGVVGIYQATQTNNTASGSSVAGFQSGKLRQFARTWLPGKNQSQNRTKSRKYVEMVDTQEEFFGSEESVELFDVDESGEFFRSGPGNGTENDHHGHHKHHHKHHHGHHKHHHKHHHRHNHSHHHKHSIKSFVEAKWKTGSLTKTSAVSNTSVLVNSTNAAVYEAKGWDSLTKKPWKFAGNKTVSGSFQQTLGSTNLDDIVVKVDSNPAFSQRVGSLPDPKLPPFGKKEQGKGPKKHN